MASRTRPCVDTYYSTTLIPQLAESAQTRTTLIEQLRQLSENVEKVAKSQPPR